MTKAIELTEVEWSKVEEEIPVDEFVIYGKVVNIALGVGTVVSIVVVAVVAIFG